MRRKVQGVSQSQSLARSNRRKQCNQDFRTLARKGALVPFYFAVRAFKTKEIVCTQVPENQTHRRAPAAGQKLRKKVEYICLMALTPTTYKLRKSKTTYVKFPWENTSPTSTRELSCVHCSQMPSQNCQMIWKIIPEFVHKLF